MSVVDNKSICSICGNEIEEFAPIYTITGNHYSCQFPDGVKSASELIADLDEKLNKLLGRSSTAIKKSKRVEEGLGAIALKAKEKAIAAVEAILGFPIYDILLWNQKGAYRGPRWDLDAWGFHFSFKDDSGHEFKGHASSLAIMTAIAKSKYVYCVKEQGFATFSIYGTDNEEVAKNKKSYP